MNTDQQAIVNAFCEECVWARCVRTHFADLYESGSKRIDLLSEVAHTFFGDLNIILQEYILLQQAKLTDPAESMGKSNLSTNHLLTLDWKDKTKRELVAANEKLMQFRDKIVVARRKLIAHTDVASRLSSNVLGSFDESEEREFWSALQHFASTAHDGACGGPFEIVATLPQGDGKTLVHCLMEAVDYDDLVKGGRDFLLRRVGKRRYENA